MIFGRLGSGIRGERVVPETRACVRGEGAFARRACAERTGLMKSGELTINVRELVGVPNDADPGNGVAVNREDKNRL